jgi:hypothetical protein
MLTGFEKIIEERIRRAQQKGDFDHLPGSGKPLDLSDDRHIPEELRMAYKILKNSDCVPPEIELGKEIRKTEALLAGVEDLAQKHRILKKLNLMIMKLNAMRNSKVDFEMPQYYLEKITDQMDSQPKNEKKKE